MLNSSYKINNYGFLFESLIRIYKPNLCVELGCLEGYSSYYIVKGLKKNKKGKLIIIDLFEDYPFRHCTLQKFKKNIKQLKVEKYIKIIQGDVFEKIPLLPDDSIDFLHIDLSNNGELLNKIFLLCEVKLKNNCLILFEGGSVERDNIDWMKKYNKVPIRKFLNSKFFKNNFQFFTFQLFPSLTICQKK
ncbi:MAG TPA: class I SAM-dependent methyltransferase [bacterium]|nr:class I SAM-dependent methyltransferase [bacterium]HOL48392.1 class I SAM-dependent methyltransferase [bacterium]HPQ19872.1 class I SAM-dependent methyltransferase [bacterium]